jgi:proteasome beta subunit
MVKMEEKVMKTGTTTVGIVCKDGIVLAADNRATSGYLIAQKDTLKVVNITDKIAVTMAGTVSDAQLLIRLLKSELKLKEVRTNIEPSVSDAANLMARMVYSNIRKMSMVPGVAHFIMAGVDEEGARLYDIFPDGTLTEYKDYISSGSGSVMAYGVLESEFKSGLSVDEGIDLAFKCINAAISRDIASGNGIDVYTITNDGAKRVIHKTIDYKLKK